MGKSWIVHGLGMFCEAYVLFSIGNLQGLFKIEYPSCWATLQDCSSGLVKSVTYTEVGGVIAGMLSMGYIADKFGRRNGSRITSAVMLLGAVLLTCSYADTLKGQFTMFTISLALFGYGVGGEYPLASASAVERSQAAPASGGIVATGVNRGRGKETVLTFSMQGVGNLVQTLLMVVLLAAFGQTSKTDLSPYYLQVVWRLQYGIGVAVLAGLSVYRFFKLQESEVWRSAPKLRIITDADDDSYRLSTSSPLLAPSAAPSTARAAAAAAAGAAATAPQSVHLLFLSSHWHRLVGTSVGWLVWDVAFYGNKLFQGRFIAAIYGNPSPFVVLQWTLLNSAVALVGYYFAAFTIDKPWMGRWRMQMMGFVVCALTFGACGIWYNTLVQPEYTTVFQVLYYLSTFFGQWGPNATTWLLPSELFPTEVRAFAHGISAAAGKLGALAAGLAFSHMATSETFLVSGVCGFVGALVTLLFLPDVTSLDISELDKRWVHVKAGTDEEYTGPAVAPQHLSYFERCCKWVSGGRPAHPSSSGSGSGSLLSRHKGEGADEQSVFVLEGVVNSAHKAKPEYWGEYGAVGAGDDCASRVATC